MDIRIKWEYFDPSNEALVKGTHYLYESSFATAVLWCDISLPLDHLLKLEIVDYSA